jgi:hypothetical protein
MCFANEHRGRSVSPSAGVDLARLDEPDVYVRARSVEMGCLESVQGDGGRFPIVIDSVKSEL